MIRGFTYILIVMLLTGCGNVLKETTTQSEASSQSFEQTVQKLDSPDKCFQWMQTNITYKSDETAQDEFRSPEETFKLHYGDCDDFAVFANYALTQHGYQTKIVLVYTQDKGHAVCAWQDAAGNWNYLSNLGIRKISATEIKLLAKDVYQDWQTYVLYPDQTSVNRPVGE